MKSRLLGHKAASRSQNKTAAPPLYAAHTATLDVVFGIRVTGVASLPADFLPDMTRAPMWLRNGTEVGVFGDAGGKAMMLGFSGANLETRRVVLEDFGAGAAGGRLLDVAVSPDGNLLASAIAQPTQNRLEVALAESANPVEAHSIAELDGAFDAAQLTWLDRSTIALFAHPGTPLPQTSSAPGIVAAGGLYMIGTALQASTRHLDGITCPLSPLAFSPNRYFAVAQGDIDAPPAIVDLHDQTCRPLGRSSPLRVLGWAPNSAAFLFAPVSPGKGDDGVFLFDMTTGRTATIAVSSGAAAYAADGAILAVGSQRLSWKRVSERPNDSVKVEVARFEPNQSQLAINSLGFETSPSLLAQTTMDFSEASDNGIIDTALPGLAGPLRELIEYSYRAHAAFVIASGPVQGAVAISWSPDGQRAAIVDGNSTVRTITVLAPPK
ncbi:MAG TPA: hypothetical protein VJN94_14130 [Candidatus Binataceae bacterium]|nr:hypothetical protein [Candidatus Binataceae bacterium]